MGRTIGEVLEMPHSEILRWQLYWNEEPWGPYRDNLHAALICGEVLRPYIEKGKDVPPLENFMLRPAGERKSRNVATFMARLNALSTKAKQ